MEAVAAPLQEPKRESGSESERGLVVEWWGESWSSPLPHPSSPPSGWSDSIEYGVEESPPPVTGF